MSQTNSRELSSAERQSLIDVLKRREPVTVLLWGEGKDRTLSFYAKGTRLEARIAYPEDEGVGQSKPSTSLTADELRIVFEVLDRELAGVMDHVEREWLQGARDKLAAEQETGRLTVDECRATRIALVFALASSGYRSVLPVLKSAKAKLRAAESSGVCMEP